MLKLNEDKLVALSVVGEITQPMSHGTWRVDASGAPSLLPGVGGITYNKRVGDSCVNLKGDHVEPGVSISNLSTDNRFSGISPNASLNTFACVGNEARVITGDAKGTRGTVTGKHGGIEHVLVDFKPGALEKMAVGDKIQIRAFGVGLEIINIPSVRVVNCSPELLKRMNIKERGKKLLVGVTHTIPAAIMGSGLGAGTTHRGDYDIQMFDDEMVKKHKLHTLRFGDIVAIKDADHSFGRIYKTGAISVGVVVHSVSVSAGHGPGVATLLTSPSGNIEPVIDKNANLAMILKL